MGVTPCQVASEIRTHVLLYQAAIVGGHFLGLCRVFVRIIVGAALSGFQHQHQPADQHISIKPRKAEKIVADRYGLEG